MQANRKLGQATWFAPALPAKARRQSQPINLGDRIKELLGITTWSELLAEGDEPYFGF